MNDYAASFEPLETPADYTHDLVPGEETTPEDDDSPIWIEPEEDEP